MLGLGGSLGRSRPPFKERLARWHRCHMSRKKGDGGRGDGGKADDSDDNEMETSNRWVASAASHEIAEEGKKGC